MFRLWSGISTIAACLQRKVSLPLGLLTIYPNEYIVLVGPSGSRKGTAMEPAYSILNDLGIKLSFESTTREALIRALAQSTSTTVNDEGTIVMHSSMTVFSKELTVFLGYSNLQLMTDLCDWYDCSKHWGYDTKHAGRDEIHGVWVNLVGATTPDLLQSAMPKDAVGSGLTARTVLVYEPVKGKVVYFPFLASEAKAIEPKLKEDLEQISLMSGEFKITEDFIESYIRWRDAHERRPPMVMDIRFAAYGERRPAHVLKLSMICSASRSNSMIIDSRDLGRADSILTAAERRMPRAFSGVGRSRYSDILIKIWNALAAKGAMKKSELMTMFHYDIDARELEGIIETMHTMKIIDLGMDRSETILIYKRQTAAEETYGIEGTKNKESP